MSTYTTNVNYIRKIDVASRNVLSKEIVKTLKSENVPKRPTTGLGVHLRFHNEIEPNDAMTVYLYLKKKINLTKSEDKCQVSKIMMQIEKKRNIFAKR